jgi:hypothetical protein
MLTYLRSRLARLKGSRAAGLSGRVSALMQQSTPATYRPVGNATMPDGERLRVYIAANAVINVLTRVMVQTAPGNFELNGQPRDLRPAVEELAQLVRAHLLGQPDSIASTRGVTFRASV